MDLLNKKPMALDPIQLEGTGIPMAHLILEVVLIGLTSLVLVDPI